jgi:PAS domain S-box-containing protein
MSSLMEAPTVDLFWTLVIGSAVGIILAVTLVSVILLSQRRYRTVQRQRLDEFIKAEQRFRTLIENSSDGIVIINKEGVITYSGPTIKRLVGYDGEEFVSHSIFEFLHPDDCERMGKVFERLTEKPGAVVTAQFRVFKEEEIAAWFEGVCTNLFHDPSINGIVINFRDITERKRSQEALKLSEEKYRTFFEEDLSGIFISTPKGQLIDCNPRFVEILGYGSKEELLGTSTYTLYQQRPDRDAYLRLLQRNRKITNYERELVRKDGKKINVVANVIGEFDENENLTLIRGYVFDVTQRKEAEERYRTLFEESKDVAFISTPSGKFLEINPAGVELFGYQSKEELLRLDLVRDLYWNPAQRHDFEKLIQHHGYVKDLELELKRKDGQKVVVQETTTVIRDPSGKIIGYRGILRDITNQKKLEEQLRQAQKMESIGTLAGGIAHDFNNILAIILGHAGSLERNNGDKEKFHRSIESLHKAVQRGAGLVHQILTFARKTNAQFESVSVNAAIEDIVKILSETFPKTITLSADLNKNIPSIVADHNQFHQVLLNLCVNAHDAIIEAQNKHSSNGSSVPHRGWSLTLRTGIVRGEVVRWQFADAAADEYIEVSVSDTGIGMNDATRSRIFEPFFTTKEKGKGTGLGLSVVYGVMKSHHGFIDVNSEPGKGTTFRLYFPVPQRIVRTSEVKPMHTTTTPGGNETILVVEDEEMLLDLVKNLLEEKGYTVMTARDGQEAIDLYTRYKKDIALVLSDMGLPKISGWDAFRKMREINPGIKAILASGYLDPNVRSEMLKAGAKDFVQKPYDVNQILVRLREVIEG